MQLFAINLENIGQNKKALKQEQYKNGEQSQQTFVGLQDVLKTSSRHVLKTSSTRLQRNNFMSSKTSWRRFQDLSQDVLKTSWKTKNCYAEDVFKTSWRHVLKTSWRHVLKTSWRHILKTSSRRLGGKQNFYWWYLYLTNLNVYLTNLCFTNYIWEI